MAGITANNMATAAAPWCSMARTYSVMHSVAFISTTTGTAQIASDGLLTCHGMIEASIATGISAARFCTAAFVRKSTPRQNRC